MKLLTAPASPFANKVRMACALASFDLPAENVVTTDLPAELLRANPLGKIPCLILDDGRTLFDNRPILQFLDRTYEMQLYPVDSLFEITRFEALCDGICDCAVAWQYEKRMRPPEKHHQPWLDKQWDKIMRGLVEVKKFLPDLSQKDIRLVALTALIGYLQLRFDGLWEQDHPELVEWMAEFETQYPHVAKLKPA